MGAASYTAHVSNEKSVITTKAKLKSVANHNLRKYRSSDYSRDNIVLLCGTENLYKDVQEVYHQEFDEALKIYNEKQKRADRRIDDYFDHVSGLIRIWRWRLFFSAAIWNSGRNTQVKKTRCIMFTITH